jgi:hypothetical protein
MNIPENAAFRTREVRAKPMSGCTRSLGSIILARGSGFHPRLSGLLILGLGGFRATSTRCTRTTTGPALLSALTHSPNFL